MSGQIEFVLFNDGTLAKRTRTGSCRLVDKEKIPRKLQERIALLALINDGHIEGVGWVWHKAHLGMTCFFVEHL